MSDRKSEQALKGFYSAWEVGHPLASARFAIIA